MATGEARRWVKRIMAVHAARTKCTDAPEPDTGEFGDFALIWDEAFRDARVVDADVDKASRLLCRQPQQWWREQLPAILAAIEADRSTNIAQTPIGGGDVPNDRHAAERASEGCRLCGGAGWAQVYHERYEGAGGLVAVTNSDGSTSRVGGRFRLCCTCVLGKWFLGALFRSAALCKDLREADRQRRDAERVAWLPKVIAGESAYRLDDPHRATGRDEEAVALGRDEAVALGRAS